MNRLNVTLTFILIVIVGHLFAQDMTIYRQANAAMFSNNYTFIKKNQSDNFGRFEQYSATDDGQIWFGFGTFTETKQKIILLFDTSNLHDRIETNYNSQHKDTLYIKWLNWWSEPQQFYKIRFTDTTQYKTVYSPDWMSEIAKIPIIYLSDKNLSLYVHPKSNIKLFDFVVTDNVNEITLYVNTNHMHTFDKSKETLKKTKNGFVAVGMWTDGRKTKFVQRKKQ